MRTRYPSFARGCSSSVSATRPVDRHLTVQARYGLRNRLGVWLYRFSRGAAVFHVIIRAGLPERIFSTEMKISQCRAMADGICPPILIPLYLNDKFHNRKKIISKEHAPTTQKTPKHAIATAPTSAKLLLFARFWYHIAATRALFFGHRFKDVY